MNKPGSLPASAPALITGRGGKGAPSVPTFFEAADTIRSSGRAYVLCLLSAGPVAGLVDGASSVFLDDVALTDSAVAATAGWQISDGLPDQKPARLPGFNATESEQPVGRTLATATPVILSRPAADAVRLTLRFPAGLVHRTARVIGPESVSVRVELATGYVAGDPDTRWSVVFDEAITEKQTTAFELQVNALVPEPASGPAGPVALRVTRTSAEATDRLISDQIVLSSVTWLLWDKLSYPGLATFALSVDAGAADGRLPRLSLDLKGRLVKIPDNYEADTRRYTGIWSGAFVTGWTDNPAWVIYDLLTDPLWGLGLDPALVDSFGLYQIARWCDEPVADEAGRTQPRFTFNAVLDRDQPASRLLVDICAAIHCLVCWSGRQLVFVRDNTDPPRLLVTKSAVADGRFVYQDRSVQDQISHAMVRWRGPDGRLATEIAIDQDSLARFGYRAAQVFLPGCTRLAQAQRHARWLLAAQHGAGQIVSWRAGLDHLADHPVRPGDVIVLDDPDDPAAAADVQAERLQATGFDQLLDPVVLRRRERAYVVRNRPGFTTTTGRYMGRPLADPAAVPRLTTARFRFDEAASDPAARLYVVVCRTDRDEAFPLDGTAVFFGTARALQTARSWQVAELRQTAPDECEVVAFAAPPDRATLIDRASVAPSVVRPVRPDLTAPPAAVINLAARQFETLAEGRLGAELELVWASADGPPPRFWRVVMTGPDATVRHLTASAAHLLAGDLVPGRWQIDVTPVSWQGRSGPSARLTHTVAADISGLPEPAAPTLIPAVGGLTAEWAAPAVGSIASYQLWEMDAADVPLRLLSVSLGRRAGVTGLTAGTTYRLAVRYIRLSGARSGFSPSATAAPLAPPRPKDGPPGPPGTDGKMVWTAQMAKPAYRRQRWCGWPAGYRRQRWPAGHRRQRWPARPTGQRWCGRYRRYPDSHRHPHAAGLV